MIGGSKSIFHRASPSIGIITTTAMAAVKAMIREITVITITTVITREIMRMLLI